MTTDHTVEPVSSTPAEPLQLVAEALAVRCELGCARRSSICRGHWSDAAAALEALGVPGRQVPDQTGMIERLAAGIHDRFEPLAGDVLLFEDCLEIAHLVASMLRADVTAAYERGKAEGRRQATEGWGREWGTVGDGWAYVARDEKAARDVARYSQGGTAASRLVGPWEPAPVTDVPEAWPSVDGGTSG